MKKTNKKFKPKQQLDNIFALCFNNSFSFGGLTRVPIFLLHFLKRFSMLGLHLVVLRKHKKFFKKNYLTSW